jgi:hypothetical protein
MALRVRLVLRIRAVVLVPRRGMVPRAMLALAPRGGVHALLRLGFGRVVVRGAGPVLVLLLVLLVAGLVEVRDLGCLLGAPLAGREAR